MPKYLMGIDNGGTSSKAAIYDLQGHEIAKHTTYTKMLTPHKYWTERDMSELKQVNIDAIKGALEKAQIDPADIIGISTTGHGNGLYLIGKNGSYVRNGIVSTDNRAHKIVENWLSDPRYEEIVRPRTYATVWASQPAALLAWLDQNEPEIYDKTEYVFMITDLVRYWLTGEARTESSNASGTSLFNQDTQEYDPEVFKFFDIEKWMSKMPPLVNSADKAGEVTEEFAKESGLVAGTPVAGGLFDITAGAISTGLVKHDQLSIVTGTWSINQYIDSKIHVVKDLFMTSNYPLEHEHLLTEASPTSGSNLTWFINTFLGDRKEIIKLAGNESIYDYCSKLVESVAPEDSKLLFYPFIFGSNAGVANSTAGFIGATKSTTIAEFLRAVYEGVVFAHRAHVEKLMKINPNILSQPIRLSGGISNSKVWLQMFADIFQQDIELVDAKENGALGTSMAAGVMSGAFDSFADAANKMVHVTRVIHPNKDKAKVYAAKYALYKLAVIDQAKVWADVESAVLV